MSLNEKTNFYNLFNDIINSVDKAYVKTLLEALKIHFSKFEKNGDIELNKEELKNLLPYVKKNSIKEGCFSYIGINIYEVPNYHREEATVEIVESLYYYRVNIRKFSLFLIIKYLPMPDLNEKLNFLFELYDDDHDGKISLNELQAILINYNDNNSINVENETVKDISNAIFDSLDENKNGYITKDCLKQYYLKYKDSVFKMKIFLTEDDELELNENNHFYSLNKKVEVGNCKTYFLLNIKYIIWLIIYILSNILWGAWFFFTYLEKGIIAVAIAKFFAGIIMWNCSLLIFFVCENFLTLFQRSRLYSFLPLRDIQGVHKLCARVFMICGFGHAFTHLAGTYLIITIYPISSVNKVLHTKMEKSLPYYELVFGTIHGLTGVFLVILLLIIFFTTLDKVIKKKFERFWYTHKLFYLILPALFLHGSGKLIAEPVFWKFILGPCLIFIVEIIIDVIRLLINKTNIISVKTIDNGIIELVISKPKYFVNAPGQYARINIPEISFLQYHPFTIASAPHHPNLVFYISPVGNWTKKLKKIQKHFSEHRESYDQSKVLARSTTNYLFYQQHPINNKMIKPYCYLDGPLGAPSERYDKYKRLIFVAAGIGGTPFSSILLNFLNDLKKNNAFYYDQIEFIWVIRQFTDATWMINLIKRLMIENTNNIFRIYIMVTCPNLKSDLRTVLFWNGFEFLKKNKNLTQFREKVYWGRPNWNDLFLQKRNSLEIHQIKERIGVFVCANYNLCKDIFNSCQLYSGKGIEFCFHMENF